MYLIIAEVNFIFLLLLSSHKFLDDPKQWRGDGLEVFVEVPLDSQSCKDVVVDQRRPQVSEHAW